MKLARSENGVVVEVVTCPDIIPVLVEGVQQLRSSQPSDFFHPDLGFEAVASDVETGWLRHESGFVPPPDPEIDPEEIKATLKSYAAAKRYDVETGGLVVNAMSIATDRQSQAMISGAYNLVTATPQSVQFKTGTGFVTLTPEDVTTIALAVGQHVQACFAKEAEVVEAIDSGTITTSGEIDAAFAALMQPG